MFKSVVTSLAIILALASFGSADDDLWVEYSGTSGPGSGKHIVLIAGDEEYRTEESMPMLGKILSQRHGFDCTVLFSIHPETREIDPDTQTNIPGLHRLKEADLMVIGTRFRELPDDDMQHIDDFVQSGRPIIGIRTATHAFNYTRNKDSRFAHYSFNSQTKWIGGFGQHILGDTWISHHGGHKHESTRGVINPQYEDHPILRGVTDVWGPTDVYGVKNLPPSAHVLLYGSVLKGMSPSDPPVDGPKNKPMMPLLWTRSHTTESGATSRIVCTTMGSSTDFQCEDLRRAFVNACYWAVGIEDQISAQSNVDYVGDYAPTEYGFDTFTRGVKPSAHRLR